MRASSKLIVKRLAIGLALLLAVLLIANSVLAWRAQRRLSDVLAELRSAGRPTTLAELAPAKIPDDENAAAQLTAISDDLKAWETRFWHEFEETKLGEAWGNSDTQGFLPSKQQLAAMEPILDAYQKILPAIDRAATTKQYASPLNYQLPVNQFIAVTLPYIQSKRGLVEYVDAKMRALAAKGKRDEAVRLGVKMLKITRNYDHDPLLMNYYVTIAVRGITMASLNGILQSGPVGEQARNELDAELAMQDSTEPLRKALESERAASPDLVQTNASWIAKLLSWPTKDYEVDLITFLNKALDLAETPWFKSHNTIQSLQPQTAFVRTLAPTLKNSFLLDNRNRVEIRALRVLNAINGFLQQKGRDPADIEELGLPPAVIVDPFSGNPLKLKRTDGGCVVYSVYENQVDDGGIFKEMKDWGLAPPGYEK